MQNILLQDNPSRNVQPTYLCDKLKLNERLK